MSTSENPMSAKRKAVLLRIDSLEQAIGKARDYLESGKNADWSGFRPLFARKFKDGKELPPHRDCVKNVFLPGKENALKRAEKLHEQFEQGDFIRWPDICRRN